MFRTVTQPTGKEWQPPAPAMPTPTLGHRRPRTKTARGGRTVAPPDHHLRRTPAIPCDPFWPDAPTAQDLLDDLHRVGLHLVAEHCYAVEQVLGRRLLGVRPDALQVESHTVVLP